jgi:type I restriction enzyme S subunit
MLQGLTIEPFPDLIDFQEGPGILAKDFCEEGVPLIRLSGLTDSNSVLSGCNYLDPQKVSKKWEHFRLINGDVLLSSSASLGRIAVVDDKAAGSIAYTGIIRMRPQDDRLFAPFIRYLLESQDLQEQLEMMGVGSVIRHFGPMHLRQMTVTFPPLPEQRRIAHILGTLDDKIENNRKTAKTLEAMAQAIFKSWFVDFDPVRAKMNGEAGESICKRLKLTPEILDLFPDRLVASELGEIPEGWGNVPFSECVTIIGGGTPKTSVLEYWDGNIPWFSIVDAPINDGIWVVDTEKKISELGLNNSSTRILPIGTTIITARGTVGRVALVGVPMAINQSCYGLRGKYDERGFFTNFSTRLIIQELRQHAHGSVFDTITRDTIESIEVTFPPIGIIGWFENAISSPMEKLKQYNEETHSITMLRDTLLPKLISGEIRVPEAELQIEETTG